MKKLLLIITSIIAVASIILMYSCNKNELNEQTKEYEDGTALAEQILAFKANMTNKNGENLPIEDALENMELLINAEHGFPFEEYGARQTDIVSFQLQADENGEVSPAEINAAYAEMINQVRQAYINTGFADKGLILVTLSINEDDKSGKTIDATVTTGEDGEPDSDNFTNCWYYGENMGQCVGTQYEGIMDGGDTIANTIAANNPIYYYYDCPGPPSQWRLILDPQPLITLQGDEYKNAEGENMIFFYPDDGSGFTDEEKQLSADDMNNYYDNEYDIIYDSIPNDPVYNYTFPTYILVTCEIDGNQFYDPNNDDILTMHHENNLTYALRYWVRVSIIEDPLPIDL